MPDLHQTIIETTIGYDGEHDVHGYAECSDFPLGLSPEDVAKLMDGRINASGILVPASVVPNSDTSREILRRNGSLEKRYVLYRGFRHGAGSDDFAG